MLKICICRSFLYHFLSWWVIKITFTAVDKLCVVVERCLLGVLGWGVLAVVVVMDKWGYYGCSAAFTPLGGLGVPENKIFCFYIIFFLLSILYLTLCPFLSNFLFPAVSLCQSISFSLSISYYCIPSLSISLSLSHSLYLSLFNYLFLHSESSIGLKSITE